MAPWSEGKITVPVSVGGPGVHLCEVRLPPDALEYDNHFYLALAVQEKEEVLIVSDATDQQRSGAYYLKTALNPYPNDVGSLLPRIISSGDLSSTRLAGVQKMFFVQINRLMPEACDCVGQFLFHGGGLIYFLDGRRTQESRRTGKNHRSRSQCPCVWPAGTWRPTWPPGPSNCARRFQIPLPDFSGGARQDLALLEFYDYYRPARPARVASAGFSDDSPAMARCITAWAPCCC